MSRAAPPTLKNLHYRTTPLVVHANGPAHQDLLLRILEAHLSRPVKPAPPSRDVTLITWNTRTTPGTLERSLDHLGERYLVLGKKTKRWNLTDKIRMAHEALDQVRTPYFMACDSFDVVILDRLDRIARQFEARLDCDAAFNAERIAWPPGFIEIEDFENRVAGRIRTVYRHLNSGVLFGKTRFCRKLYAEGMQLIRSPIFEKYTDQLAMRYLHMKHHPKLRIDYRCTVFQSLYGVAPGELSIFARTEDAR